MATTKKPNNSTFHEIVSSYGIDNNAFIRLFMYHNQAIPSRLEIENIDTQKVSSWLTIELMLGESNITTKLSYNRKSKAQQYSQKLFMVAPDVYLIIYPDGERHNDKIQRYDLLLLYTHTSNKMLIAKIEREIEGWLKHEAIDNSQKIFLLTSSGGDGLDIDEFSLHNELTVDIDRHYNDDILEMNAFFMDELSKKNGKGLFLLHGTPGTGKTTYIRNLGKMLNKKMIYVSPQMAGQISSPEFLPLFMAHPNSILVIEDAENILISRAAGENASVSNLLNLSDGILSDCLNIQIICSFNNSIQNIDPALLRKGRLKGSYEFGPLSALKAQALSNSLGFNTQITSPMTLAEIFNQKRETGFKVKNGSSIGFKKELA